MTATTRQEDTARELLSEVIATSPEFTCSRRKRAILIKHMGDPLRRRHQAGWPDDLRGLY